MFRNVIRYMAYVTLQRGVFYNTILAVMGGFLQIPLSIGQAKVESYLPIVEIRIMSPE
jgi:hypothetical protein